MTGHRVTEPDRLHSHSLRSWIIAVLAGLVACAFSLGVGYYAGKSGVAGKLRDELGGLLTSANTTQDSRPVLHEKRSTVFHSLDVAKLPVGEAWSLAELDGHLLFASRGGAIAFLTGEKLTRIHPDVPLGLEAFEKSRLAKAETIGLSHVRVTDLLAIETAPHRYDLYAAHLKFEDECFRLVVSRIGVTTSVQSITPSTDGWTQIYKIRDCIGPRPNGVPFIGDQSGGRLVKLDAQHLALSVGDFESVGTRGHEDAISSAASDLGKIVAIPLSRGQPYVYASGLRNPQGLMLSRTGALWETEHGPRGGDEVNLIKSGLDYGWPHVTYGRSYGEGGSPVLPVGTVQGAHDGYERPHFAFVPSIGISNLVEPQPAEFPAWGHHLLVASLKGNALHLLRLEGEVIVSDEPITFSGVRIRDLINLSDGRLAFASDEGDVFIISNAERAASHQTPALIAGIKAMPDHAAALGAQAGEGQMLFARMCAECHSLTGDVRGGPPLNGILERAAGQFPGFPYSDAMAGRGETWTKERLAKFLTDVNATYPGALMPQPDNQAAIPYIVDYLAARKK